MTINTLIGPQLVTLAAAQRALVIEREELVAEFIRQFGQALRELGHRAWDTDPDCASFRGLSEDGLVLILNIPWTEGGGYRLTAILRLDFRYPIAMWTLPFQSLGCGDFPCSGYSVAQLINRLEAALKLVLPESQPHTLTLECEQIEKARKNDT
jgi:hypothetical protein